MYYFKLSELLLYIGPQYLIGISLNVYTNVDACSFNLPLVDSRSPLRHERHSIKLMVSTYQHVKRIHVTLWELSMGWDEPWRIMCCGLTCLDSFAA
jgi:hypothetical protein